MTDDTAECGYCEKPARNPVCIGGWLGHRKCWEAVERDYAEQGGVDDYYDDAEPTDSDTPTEAPEGDGTLRTHTTDQSAAGVSDLLANDPFAAFAPSDPLALLLVAHQRMNITECRCGWSVLGASHAVHVAEVIRANVVPPERAILLDLLTALHYDVKTVRQCMEIAYAAERRLAELDGAP